MSLEEYSKFYDTQTNILAVTDRMTAAVERMETAISGAVDRMAALLKMTEKTDATADNLKKPMENMLKSISGKAIGEKVDWGAIFNPRNLAVSIAIGVGWELFGDDIMTLLSPAMAALEAFAGLVHGVVAGLAPVLSLVSGAIGGIAMVLGNLGVGISIIQPILGGLAASFGLLYLRTVAVTIAQTAQAAASKIAGAAQKVLDLALNASPMMKVAMIILGIVTALISWMSATGALKDVWASIMNWLINKINGLFEFLNKLPGVNIELIPLMDPGAEDSMKVEQPTPSLPESTMPELSMPVSYEPDYSAMTPQMPDYGAGLNAAALNAEPLRVETVGTLEGVTGAVTISEETMGGLGVMMAENRPQITVAPNIVINATVREEADIRKIVAALDRHLDEECQASATGVYFGARGRTAAC